MIVLVFGSPAASNIVNRFSCWQRMPDMNRMGGYEEDRERRRVNSAWRESENPIFRFDNLLLYRNTTSGATLSISVRLHMSSESLAQKAISKWLGVTTLRIESRRAR